jgi:hypothetical protein
VFVSNSFNRVCFAAREKIAMEASKMTRVQRINGPTERGRETQLVDVIDALSADVEYREHVDAALAQHVNYSVFAGILVNEQLRFVHRSLPGCVFLFGC